MQHNEINDVIMTVQLEEECNTSVSGKHSYKIASSMAQSIKKPFKISAAVVFVTAYMVATLLLPGVVAIKCFECNSKNDPRCGENFSNFTIALVDCDMNRDNDIPHLDDEQLAIFNREVNKDGEYVEDESETDKNEKPVSFCRKTLQTINDEFSIVRGCGWVKNFGSLRDRKCFARTGTHQIQMYHCVCGGKDGCNGAEQSSFSFALLILPLIPAYIFHISG